MCGRYVYDVSEHQLETEFNFEVHKSISYRSYNISPHQNVPIIFIEKNKKMISLMEWGILPSWAKNKEETLRPINARIETVGIKPTFKNAFENRRCLVPASGFYEWDKYIILKQPYYFYLPQHPVFAFAGIWEYSFNVYSFTILTCKANSSISSIHQRMPIVLQAPDYEAWLYKAELPNSSPSFSFHAVSKLVNKPDNNIPSLIECDKSLL